MLHTFGFPAHVRPREGDRSMSDAAPAVAAGEAPADAREARPAPVVAATARPKKKAKGHWSGVAPGETFEVTVDNPLKHQESAAVTLKMRRGNDGLSESMEEGWVWKAKAESKTDNHNGVAEAVRATANAAFVKVKLRIGSKQRQSTIKFGPASATTPPPARDAPRKPHDCDSAQRTVLRPPPTSADEPTATAPSARTPTPAGEAATSSSSAAERSSDAAHRAAEAEPVPWSPGEPGGEVRLGG
eukprot:3535401-Prymnesium_polylepis.1